MVIGKGFIQMEEKNQSENKVNDWRLQGQEKYLKDAVLQKKKYESYRNGWDHDHCEFCSAKFTEDILDTLHIGYVTNKNYHWICEDCYEEFKALFRWKLA